MIIAVDTNVLLRLIARDDATHTAVAESFLESRGIHLLPTVLLETEWVLRSVYRGPRTRIAHALNTFLRTEGVTAPHPDRMQWALARYAEGAYLADMLHLAEVHGCDGFATFDQRVADGAGDEAPVAVMVVGVG